MNRMFFGTLGAVVALSASLAMAEPVVVQMNLISDKGVGQPLGTVTMDDSADGLVLNLVLADTLSPGPHGFHVHENGSCEPAMKDGKRVAGLAAGGHFDPDGAGGHGGPGGPGHRGDMPVIYVQVDEDGATAVKEAKLAPRLTLADVRGRALMIHASGDNYKDDPKPLGGGGARVACGVVPE